MNKQSEAVTSLVEWIKQQVTDCIILCSCYGN